MESKVSTQFRSNVEFKVEYQIWIVRINVDFASFQHPLQIWKEKTTSTYGGSWCKYSVGVFANMNE